MRKPRSPRVDSQSVNARVLRALIAELGYDLALRWLVYHIPAVAEEMTRAAVKGIK